MPVATHWCPIPPPKNNQLYKFVAIRIQYGWQPGVWHEYHDVEFNAITQIWTAQKGIDKANRTREVRLREFLTEFDYSL